MDEKIILEEKSLGPYTMRHVNVLDGYVDTVFDHVANAEKGGDVGSYNL